MLVRGVYLYDHETPGSSSTRIDFGYPEPFLDSIHKCSVGHLRLSIRMRLCHRCDSLVYALLHAPTFERVLGELYTVVTD